MRPGLLVRERGRDVVSRTTTKKRRLASTQRNLFVGWERATVNNILYSCIVNGCQHKNFLVSCPSAASEDPSPDPDLLEFQRSGQQLHQSVV